MLKMVFILPVGQSGTREDSQWTYPGQGGSSLPASCLPKRGASKYGRSLERLGVLMADAWFGVRFKHA